MKFRLELTRNSYRSKVFLDDVDISDAIYGVEIRVMPDEVSLVKLTLSPELEITGEAGRVLTALEKEQAKS